MPEKCEVVTLANSESLECSPVQSVGMSQKSTPRSIESSSSSGGSLIMTIGFKHQTGNASICKIPYVKRFVEDGNVLVGLDEMKTIIKKPTLKKSSSRLFLGFLPSGQKLVLCNCPMDDHSDSSLANTDTESES